MHLKQQQRLPPAIFSSSPDANPHSLIDLADIYGQDQAKRALMIAAAGHHNILLDGPPGAGKTMLAKALMGILPPLNDQEVIEVTKLPYPGRDQFSSQWRALFGRAAGISSFVARIPLTALRRPRHSHCPSYPADFMLVATQNPCPCGFAGDPTKECVCSIAEVNCYQKRVSGPLMDRIDMVVTVARVEHDKLLGKIIKRYHHRS